MYCNPDICPHCTYIGEGDSVCMVLQELVLEDWTPTRRAMASGCIYRRLNEAGRRRVFRHKRAPGGRA